MAGTLPPWKKGDNLRTRPHQAVVNAVNELSLLAGPEGSEVHRTPFGTGLSQGESAPTLPIYRMRVTEVLSPTAYPNLTKARFYDGSEEYGEEQIVRTHSTLEAEDDFLAAFPIGGVTKIDDAEATYEDEPVLWEEILNKSEDLFRVTLSDDGGDDGSAIGAPTYTYTVNRLGTVVATGQSPEVPRPFGSFSPAVYGTAYINDSGDIVLFQAFEVPNTYECEAE